ncbi:hypothetical protein KIN20_019358, partial [Parelaphostrongylus tenuis]
RLACTVQDDSWSFRPQQMVIIQPVGYSECANCSVPADSKVHNFAASSSLVSYCWTYFWWTERLVTVWFV